MTFSTMIDLFGSEVKLQHSFAKDQGQSDWIDYLCTNEGAHATNGNTERITLKYSEDNQKQINGPITLDKLRTHQQFQNIDHLIDAERIECYGDYSLQPGAVYIVVLKAEMKVEEKVENMEVERLKKENKELKDLVTPVLTRGIEDYDGPQTKKMKYHFPFQSYLDALNLLFQSSLEANTILKFPSVGSYQWFDMTSTPFFCRFCYSGILSQIMEMINSNEKGVIVSGNPGIGKTYFLLYCIVILVRDYTILYHDIETDFIYHITCINATNLSLKLFNGEAVDREKTILLINSGVEPKLENKFLVSIVKFTIMASPPRRSHYKNLLYLGFNLLYMPTWTFDEIVLLSHVFGVSSEDVQKKFDKYDGIPRNCFIVKSLPDMNILMNNVKIETIKKLIEYPAHFSTLQENNYFTISYSLFKIIPTSDFKEYSISFLSNYVMVKLPDILAQRERNSIIILVCDALVGIPSAQSLRGYLFESISHGRIARGGSFLSSSNDKIFTLSSISIVNQPKEDRFETFVNTKLSIIPRDTYIRFERKNFGLIDSMYWPTGSKVIIGFQMTVSSTHSFNMDMADLLLNKATEIDSSVTEFHIYYVVPKDVYESFTCPLSSEDEKILCLKMQIEDY